LQLEVNVHSSTSSFRTLPQGWFSLAVGAAFSVIALVGWELFWRSRDFEPTLVDSEALWCAARRDVARDSVVIVGSSRLQAALDPRAMSSALGNRSVVQLAINGANPAPVLKNLADDSTFAGAVVLEYMPLRLLSADSASVARAQGFVRACEHSTRVSRLDASTGRILQERFVFMSPELHPISILSIMAKQRRIPFGSYMRLRTDRFLGLTFREDVTDGGRDQALSWEPDRSLDDVTLRLSVLRQSVEKIQSRGGSVILYRPPVGGGILADEEARFPAATWLPRTAATLGVPTIDFAALPELHDVPTPDGGHIHERDAARVSVTVGREMLRLGVER
jgi:hypothetical protein